MTTSRPAGVRAQSHPAHAVVTLGARRWELGPGGTLTFGRGPDRQIRFADDPPDDLVSRSAGVLIGQSDGVLVRNESRKRALVLQAVPGPEFEIPPLMAMGTMPYPQTRLIAVGAHGARYVLGIDTRSLQSHLSPAGDPPLRAAPYPGRAVGPSTTAGYERIEELSAAERRYLAALCEPLLTKVGAASNPPTYGDIANRCGVSPRTARNVLDQLRLRLTAEFGIPGLVAPDGGAGSSLPGRTSFLGALARWAVDSGNATRDDLEALDEGDDGSRSPPDGKPVR